MNTLLDKFIVFSFCLAFYIHNAGALYAVVPVIVAITTSSLNYYYDNHYVKSLSFLMYIGICFFMPEFIPFIPLICYDVLLYKAQWLTLLALLPILTHLTRFTVFDNIFTLSIISVTFLLKYKTKSIEKITNEYISLRDTAKEFSMQLENKNKELMEKQDYETNLATLNERNRISHEIHDNVGHLLSSSILQIGALMATSKDETVKESLNIIKTTLSQGMDSIRNSIHNLHEESIDLYTETYKLVKNFSFCAITLDYDIESNPNTKLKYSFLSILKESLSNIIKHSNATNVEIIMREHPALYQLVIKDNGTKKDMESEDGLGIKNIIDRITSLGGIVNISNEKGFKIFISVPK